MSERNFRQMLDAMNRQGKYLCFGFDPVVERIPESFFVRHEMRREEFSSLSQNAFVKQMFCNYILDAVGDIAAAIKPNFCFFESNGSDGIRMLENIVPHIRETLPDVPIILDRKLGDIGASNEGALEFAFDILGADAITVQPYLGRESLQSALDRKDKGIFVLCHTSNPGAENFQHLITGSMDQRSLLYECVAQNVLNHWNKQSNCGLVVGATFPAELKNVRAIVGDYMPLLIPGVGKKQGGRLEDVIPVAGRTFLVNASSEVLYAEDPAKRAQELSEQIRQLVSQRK